MADRFSLKDHLFNAGSVGDLAAEIAATLPDFDADRFVSDTLAGFPARELLQRLDWIVDCLEPHLSRDFPAMADQLQAAMPPPLDPSRTDDDFGRFIHAVPGILAVRHGLEDHCDRALDLLYAATQRFSMEFYIRPFLNRWPDQTLARLAGWADDSNYHVRRLVSEGTRPKLPWAKAVTLGHDQTLPLLDRLHADPTRYVTRSVANHLNDIAKTQPDLVTGRLHTWRDEARQTSPELDWMTRHALRTLIKSGHAEALTLMGYDPDAKITARINVTSDRVRIGDVLEFTCNLGAAAKTPVLVDYVIGFRKAGGKSAPKVFKLKQSVVAAGEPLVLTKRHKLKGDATTFRLYPGAHTVSLQVNGRIVAQAEFELVDH
jgi:3-methyladenine DNA glycosylase AlkC